ncbi:hypothetical protein GBA65_22105 (plasmid) [Rubrobacter marinus]|uniref:DNA primase n=1 Tax=Rubrobacter marinus TaxID=2653852 RepID=A0A6G8Q3V8_9ACTN|nr:hypothetical protein [Rubrobacter marinus]QIN81129.1 hypothetical protein GBA65_22105 [Rubrobacter marinus]
MKGEVLAVCSRYLGPGKTSGKRTTYRCSRCGKEKFEANHERGIAGCWNEACAAPRCTDALGLVAFFEGLDERLQFPEVVKKAHEVAGVVGGMRAAGPRPSARARAAGSPGPEPQRAEADPEVKNAAYRRLLSLCPPTDRSLAFWRSRGVGEELVAEGRFGEATPKAARAATRALERALGRKRLLGVPGFFAGGGRGRISFTLVGDYALIPYHDREGRITTIEGRALTATQEERTGKYVSLRGSANHLYVFPRYRPDDLLAFCEGPIGAIVAARYGLAVGAIQGLRRFHAPGAADEPLPELRGADLQGRVAPYVPDRGVGKELAEETACALAEPARGLPAVAVLPEHSGTAPVEDLDGWLLSLPPDPRVRRAAFGRLLAVGASSGEHGATV